MRPTIRALALLLLLAGLAAGCSRPTPYQAKGPDGMGPRYGFAEQPLAADRYRITASGNEATSRETIENYLLFRAGELALERGYPGFQVVERAVEPVTRYVTTYGYGSGLGRPLGYAFVPGPLYNPGYLGGPREAYSRPFVRYRASAEILLLERLPERPRPDVYCARDVITQLAPAINSPGSLAD